MILIEIKKKHAIYKRTLKHALGKKTAKIQIDQMFMAFGPISSYFSVEQDFTSKGNDSY